MPLFLAVPLCSTRFLSWPQAALSSYLFFIASVLVTCHWIYAGASTQLGLAAYGIAFAGACIKGVPFAVSGGVLALIRRLGQPFWMLSSLGLITASELLETTGAHAFPFATLSASQVNTELAQSVLPYLGPLGVTAFITTLSSLTVIALLSRRWRLLGPVMCGYVLLLPWPLPAPMATTPRSMLLVQGRSMGDLERLTIQHRGLAGLSIWPEDSAFVSDAPEMSRVLSEVSRTSASARMPIIAGIGGFDGAELANRAVLVGAPGVIATYKKQRLVPFAEYVPYREQFQPVFPVLSALRDMTAGTGISAFHVSGLLVRPLICYEAVFGEFLSRLHPGEIPVAITDDSWFTDPSGPLQQLDLFRVQAISFGTPIVVVGTNGPSGVLDPRGLFTAATLGTGSGAAVISVPADQHTLFSRWHYWPLAALLALVVVVMLRGALTKKRAAFTHQLHR